MGEKYDLIVFGATGYTGKYVVEEVAKLHQYPSIPFSWAIAGRSEAKLKKVLKEVSKIIGSDITKTGIVVAELNNLTSMFQLAAQCCVLINCVGPYSMHGERVMQSCLLEGTDYVDINAEIQCMERMRIQYHGEAQEKQCYIISSCGTSSILTDCGVTHLQRTFKGDLNSVEAYYEWNTKGQTSRINQGSWHSAIITLANPLVHIGQQSKLFPIPVPKPKYSIMSRWPIHYSDKMGGWCVRMPATPEISSVKRSQYHFHNEESQRPVQFNFYYKASSLLNVFSILYSLIVCFMFAQFRFSRNFLAKMAEFFTNGIVSDKNPTREENESSDLRLTLLAEGWDTKQTSVDKEHPEPPNKKQKFVVTLKDPIFGSTAVMVVQAALSILLERHKLPSGGGVFTPGVAFANTTIIDRLNSRGITFKSV
ncbi:unnamed protein product [Allacma fusca]|uniref:Saccharopine dehydrogenase NADP binding domain-containing protein n=1 Tax=Allacma fusca TaxID=39272 RepID=A0A8J2JYJ5_9HEXA|nr:unnamed protein product [Allacma fusca]